MWFLAGLKALFSTISLLIGWFQRRAGKAEQKAADITASEKAESAMRQASTTAANSPAELVERLKHGKV